MPASVGMASQWRQSEWLCYFERKGPVTAGVRYRWIPPCLDVADSVIPHPTVRWMSSCTLSLLPSRSERVAHNAKRKSTLRIEFQLLTRRTRTEPRKIIVSTDLMAQRTKEVYCQHCFKQKCLSITIIKAINNNWATSLVNIFTSKWAMGQYNL